MTWANQVRMLKENFRALGVVLGRGLINALKPFVSGMNTALQAVTKFATNVLNALGKIFGWQVEMESSGLNADFASIGDDLGVAGDAADDLGSGAGNAADNLGKAAKAAKQLKTTALGIDELNLNQPDNSGGGSGGSGGSGGGGGGSGSGGSGGSSSATGGDVAFTFKETEKFYESMIDNLFDLGDYIGDTIADSLESINWDHIQTRAKSFANGLASFLNGLISPRLFYDFGMTVAEVLNTAIDAALSFGDTFSFKNLGASISSGINGFFATFEFDDLAAMVNQWVDNLFDFIEGFLKGNDNGTGGIQWSLITDGIGDFLSNLDIDTVAVILGTLLIKQIAKVNIAGGALSVIGTAITTGISAQLALAGPQFMSGIAGALSGGGLASFATSGFAATISSGIIGAIGGGILSFGVGYLATKLTEWIGTECGMTTNEIQNGKTGATIGSIGGAIVGGIITFFTGGAGLLIMPIATAVGGAIGGAFGLLKNNIMSFVTTHSVSDIFKAIFNAIGNLPDLIGELGGTLGSLIGQAVAWISGAPKVFLDAATDLANSLGDALVNMDTFDIAKSFGETIGTLVANAFKLAIEIPGAIVDFVANLFSNFIEEVGKVDWLEVGTNIVEGVIMGLADIGLVAANIVEAIGGFFAGVVQAFKDVFDIHSPSKAPEITEIGTNILKGVVEGIKDFIKTPLDIGKGVVNWISKALGFGDDKNKQSYSVDVGAKLSTTSGDVSKWWTTIKGWWGDKKIGITSKLETAKQNVNSWWNNIKGWWGEKKVSVGAQNGAKKSTVSGWWSTIKGWFGNHSFSISAALSTTKATVQGWASNIKTWWNNNKPSLGTSTWHLKFPVPSISWEKVTKFGVTATLPKLGIEWKTYATGGFPDMRRYSLFSAGEGGVPEMLGTVGGRTAVAGGAEITGIKDAVNTTSAAEIAVLQTMVSLLQVIADKDYDVTLDGRSLVSAVDRRKARNGFSFT